MKKLTTPSGVFGPYSTVETLDDRYRCDGADLPFTVVGEGEIEDWTGPHPTPEASPPTRDQLKAQRTAAVAAITVTTNSGNTFDGDETSQERMARAILVMQATATPSTMWVLHDNTPATVTAVELVEALALAGAAQSALWVIA